ncbi:DEAD/DEAH box helicase family protein [Paenibacillus sp. IB182496]|uniref:DEAD/DEAH box helicase family protein n=1 Tax=Paenibacillus sabuli TaxID=2772509 RepID=A0A927BTQ4_9BACL|nr:DEAD/DEAH box helicase family protein [Paenibacillus sabuli]MBD2846627.1 DEAD/DEAH box helicase family protein [Paenibacillus sabuli]
MSATLNVKLITENLADELIAGMQQASGIYILTSFVMQSGVRLLAPHLRRALERGAEVKALAGDYLFVTQPEGLQALTDIDSRIEARLWRSNGTSFHPKAYLFDYDNGEGLLVVGSSNFSMSAMRMGMEWNLAMNAKAEPYTFQVALEKFMHSYYHEATQPLNAHTIARYAEEYRECHRLNPELTRLIAEMEEAEVRGGGEADPAGASPDGGTDSAAVTPRYAQIEALEALERTCEEEYDKAMVVMATGLGKTYLAAFFARRYPRVLFVAHREEILHQGRRSFRHVLPDRSHGLYNGTVKEGGADCVFASIYTLGMKKHREAFAPERFDLIVVDEFHHAAAASYQAVIGYFRPRFLLGITATPDRMDGKDVYALCEGNVAYQLHFIEAIRRGWLAPFRYYGVYDDTDYSTIRRMGGRYDEEQLAAAQLRQTMAARILEAWERHRQTRTIGFCSSIRQADFLAGAFRAQGHAALSLHSGTVDVTREAAIRQLTAGELDVIFTVDLFNEGVDIPSVDTLLFVRPTESLTVFTQQVGRGLRLSETKTHCAIIDLIGNYRNADIKLRLFAGEAAQQADAGARAAIAPAVPDGCALQLETAVVDLLEALRRKRMPQRERLHHAFVTLQQELGRIPTYLELHLHGGASGLEYRAAFGSYVGFLHWAGCLSEAAAQVYERHADWLRDVETTGMTKSYKMVVLLYMLERGPQAWTDPVTPGQAAPFFHRYLTVKAHRRRIDFSDRESRRLWTYDEAGVSRLIARMPMAKWSAARGSMTRYEDGVFRLAFGAGAADRATLHRWTREVCLYRLHAHFERRAGRGDEA